MLRATICALASFAIFVAGTASCGSDSSPPGAGGAGGVGVGGGSANGGGGANDGGGSGGGEGGTASCGQGSAGVDQSSLTQGADLGLPLGQTFQVGKAGALVGIELSLASCDGALPSGALFTLIVTDDQGVMLGNASLSPSSIPTSCPAAALTADAKGQGYFDLSKTCIKVTAGQKLSFKVDTTGVPAGTCDPSARTCTTGKSGVCMHDQQCDYVIESAAAGKNAYPNGNVIEDSMSVVSDDLDFKTFVE